MYFVVYSLGIMESFFDINIPCDLFFYVSGSANIFTNLRGFCVWVLVFFWYILWALVNISNLILCCLVVLQLSFTICASLCLVGFFYFYPFSFTVYILREIFTNYGNEYSLFHLLFSNVKEITFYKLT